jgi:hypothetical protein
MERSSGCQVQRDDRNVNLFQCLALLVKVFLNDLIVFV